MVFSIIVFFYFVVIQFLENNTRGYINKGLSVFVLILSFIILNIVRVYAQSFFPDIPNYKLLFEPIHPISFVIESGYGLDDYNSNVEIGFRVLISIFKLFSNNFSFFLFFISFFQLLVFSFFCKKYKVHLVNAIPIYFALTYLTFQIGMSRQALAFCFFLLALVYINRKIVYILFLILGATFHTSILFCIIFLWSDKFVNRSFLYVIFLISLVLYLLEIDIVSSFLPLLELQDTIQTGRIDYYVNVNRANSYLGIGFWDRLLLFVLMNLVYTEMLKKNRINKKNNLIFNLGVSVIIIQMIFFSSPTITSRLRYYIVIFPLIFISEYIYSEYVSSNSKFQFKLKWLYQILFVLYLLMYLYFQATYLV